MKQYFLNVAKHDYFAPLEDT